MFRVLDLWKTIIRNKSLQGSFKKAAVIAALFSLLKTIFKPAAIQAQIVDPGVPNQLCDLNPIIENIINISVSIAAVILFIMLVWGGLAYMTSGGAEPKKMQDAQNTITYAIVGIILLILAWFILWFLEIFTGVTVTKFFIECPS